MRRSWSRICALALGLPLLLTIFLAACGAGGGGGGATPSTTIKIGSDLPVSGKDTSSGLPAQNGAALAIKQANDSNAIPGYKLVFVPKDDVGPSGAHDPAVGKKNVDDLIGDALVAGIVGPFNSSVAKSEMPDANKAPIALISPANTNQCLTQEGADIGCSGANDLVPSLRPTGKVTYFRIATTDNHQGAVIADYLYQKKGLKTVYIFDDTETYGAGIANVFEQEWKKDGGTVLDHKSLPSSTTSFVQSLTVAASTKPDAIFCGCTDSTIGTPLRQQMLQVGALKNTPFAGGDGIQTSGFATAVGVTGGPAYSTVAAVNPDTLPSAQDFIKTYKATYTLYGAYAAGAYDCAKIYIQAIKTALDKGVKTPVDSNDATQAKVFRQAVIDAIQHIDYSGVTGHHTFDMNGDTTDKVIAIYQLALVNGKPDWKFVDQLTLP
jgi:branched-chain amino acid transport system substrate-binding protein